MKQKKLKKTDRAAEARKLLEALTRQGVKDVEIAYKVGVAIQTVWRWSRENRAPTPLYFEALKKFAKEKGIP